MPWVFFGGLALYGLFLVLRYLFWWVEIDEDEVRWRSSIGTHHHIRYAEIRRAWVTDDPFGLVVVSKKRFGLGFRILHSLHWTDPVMRAARDHLAHRAMGHRDAWASLPQQRQRDLLLAHLERLERAHVPHRSPRLQP